MTGMSVIKDEYINDKVTMHDLLPLGFLKKSAYTGSKGKLRYRIEKKEEGEGDEIRKFLSLSIWRTPFAYDKTPAEEMTVSEHPFSNDGLNEIIEVLNSNL